MGIGRRCCCAAVFIEAWLVVSTAATSLAAAQPRFFDGDFEPFPVCQARYNAPCSHTNIRKVARTVKATLEAQATAAAVGGIIASISAGAYDNGADGFGFGPLVARFADGAVLADAENPALAGTGLDGILSYNSSGCGEVAAVPGPCYQSAMTIIQQGLLARWQQAAVSGDGLVPYVWTRRGAPAARGKQIPDRQIGFVLKANTTAGELMVVSAFSDEPLPLSQPACSAGNNEICSIGFSRRLVGDALAKMTMATSHGQLESVLHDITFNRDLYKLPSGFYIFVYRFGAPGSPGQRGECVAHGARSDFIGKNLPEILAFVGNRAVDGWSLHESFSAAAENGGGWVDYAWKNRVEEDAFYKIAFIAGTLRFGIKYYLGVGFTHAHPPVQSAPHCGTCSAGSSYPCSSRNAYLLISHSQSLLLTDINETFAWSQLTTADNSSGFGQAEVAGYKFDGGFYNFAYDFNGTCVAHGQRADFVGLTLWAITAMVGLSQDCNATLRNCSTTAVDGTALNDAFVQVAMQGGGWFRYHWRNSASEPTYEKVAYLVKISKFGREFYVGVGYALRAWMGEDAGTATACSAEFAGACSEDNVLAIVGHLAAAISTAQTRGELREALSIATNGTATGGPALTQGQLGPYRRAGNFFVEVYDANHLCVAHGSNWKHVGKTLDEIFLDIGSQRISPGQFSERFEEKAHIGGWFVYDWQTADMSAPEKRIAFALKAVYSPRGSAISETYHLLGSFAIRPAPTRCERGCPAHASCDASRGRCRCNAGFGMSFRPAEHEFGETCNVALDLPMECVDVRGRDCGDYGNGTLACTPCGPGRYCPAGEPTLCTQGKYCPEGSVEPVLCEDGHVTLRTGESSSAACQPCREGTAWSRQLSSTAVSVATCLECTPGKFAGVPGSSECELCLGFTVYRDGSCVADVERIVTVVLCVLLSLILVAACAFLYLRRAILRHMFCFRMIRKRLPQLLGSDFLKDFELVHTGDHFSPPQDHAKARALKEALCVYQDQLALKWTWSTAERSEVMQLSEVLIRFFKMFVDKVEEEGEKMRRLMLHSYEKKRLKYLGVYNSVVRGVIMEDESWPTYPPAVDEIRALIGEAMVTSTPSSRRRSFSRSPAQDVEGLSWKHQLAQQGCQPVLTTDLSSLSDLMQHSLRCQAWLARVCQEIAGRVGATVGHGRQKGMYRVLEKAALERRGKVAEVNRCRDAAREMILCSNVATIVAVLRCFQAEMANQRLLIVSYKDRFQRPTPGGWADCLLCVVRFDDPAFHIAEVQIVHGDMVAVRRNMGAHHEYNEFRAIAEICQALKWSLPHTTPAEAELTPESEPKGTQTKDVAETCAELTSAIRLNISL